MEDGRNSCNAVESTFSVHSQCYILQFGLVKVEIPDVYHAFFPWERSMIGVIWDVLQPFILEVFRKSNEIVAKRNDWKRRSIGRFMTLYDNLSELHETSVATYAELVDIAMRNGAISRVVVEKRLKALSESAKKFVDAARNVGSILEIYNDDLLTKIKRSPGFAGVAVEV